MADAAAVQVEHKRPIIGAFVLETLTLGMYGEPRHTLREYVQNSFDSIRAAERMKLLSGRGRVEIVVSTQAIKIRDNGVGVSSEQARTTLTSIGASKKDRQRDAGFRGIGRLAGMAYCEELVFRTTFAGETIVTTVRFDCTMLLAAMSPDTGGEMELAKLLDESILVEQEEGADESEHFFEVILSGLGNAPKALTDPAEVRDYLSETAPVDFAPDWEHRDRVKEEYRSYFGEMSETIDIFVTADGERDQIYKPYHLEYNLAKGMALLERVEFFQGEDGLYWGWVGYLSKSGAVTDLRTRGLRVRARNIQVDGTEILERLFAKVKPSYGRFSAYYVGEIHVDHRSVVPNARRDGFEETNRWLEIQDSLRTNICEQLASDAYAASRSKQLDVRKMVEDINALVERSHSLAANSRASYDQVVDLMNAAKRLRRRAVSALKLVEDLDDTVLDLAEPGEELSASELQEAAKDVDNVEKQARMLIGQTLSDDERIDALKQRLRQEIVKELLDIVTLFVDPLTYQKIRRRLMKAAGTQS